MTETFLRAARPAFRWWLVFALAVVWPSVVRAADRVVAAARPNVLIVLADQWRAQAFGFAGDPNVRTPHFDRLASESARFVNAISGLPVCSPTRASLMTGQRPLTHGVFLNDVPLSTNAVTLAKVLANAGYRTGMIGKWHIDGRGRSNFIPPERRQGLITGRCSNVRTTTPTPFTMRTIRRADGGKATTPLRRPATPVISFARILDRTSPSRS